MPLSDVHFIQSDIPLRVLLLLMMHNLNHKRSMMFYGIHSPTQYPFVIQVLTKSELIPYDKSLVITTVIKINNFHPLAFFFIEVLFIQPTLSCYLESLHHFNLNLWSVRSRPIRNSHWRQSVADYFFRHDRKKKRLNKYNLYECQKKNIEER